MKKLILILFIFWCSFLTAKNAESKDRPCYDGTSAAIANVQEIHSTFFLNGLSGFCYCPTVNDYPIIPEYRQCIYQTTLQVDDWLGKEGGCYSKESFELQKRIIKQTREVTIENNFIVGGSRSMQFVLMRAEAPCNLTFFDYDADDFVNTSEGKMPVWILGLHLIYTNYGELDSWPMPNKLMQKEFIRKFGVVQKITKDHKNYLYKEWKTYLMKHNDKAKRWTPFSPANENF